MKRWFLPAAARARGQSNDLNREILASNLFNCRKEVINAPPVPSVSRCIHIVYRHKNIREYQWSNFIYNCMSTFLHYVRCKDALLDCSAPGGERCESLTGVDEIEIMDKGFGLCPTNDNINSKGSFSELLFSFDLEKYIICDICTMKSPAFETTSLLYVTPADSTSMQELLMQEHKQKLY